MESNFSSLIELYKYRIADHFEKYTLLSKGEFKKILIEQQDWVGKIANA
jgi:hypothetical protein